MFGIQRKPMQAIIETESPGSVQRHDMATEKAVERGILLQSSVGTLCALEFLQAEGVSHIVAQRVLSEPTRRRSRP
ncbi:hypothetical protein [Undibacterium sp.]|jgi:hypothetical protein|uniref:hypothetical protein n=1 Tax=Undibacterium sp. TaxID=1914977 RepID=UPI002C389D6E|nr:hypothetical protein [Undibacterium sp.]HTD03808.1 hypothetical protein [Undibacterium sp.]